MHVACAQDSGHHGIHLLDCLLVLLYMKVYVSLGLGYVVIILCVCSGSGVHKLADF